MKYELTYNNEIGVGSKSPHHPSNYSGVTIGAGMDLKHFTKKEAGDIFKRVNISLLNRIKLTAACGLYGQNARVFCDKNKEIEITDEQQYDLFLELTPSYEDRAINDYNNLLIVNKPKYEDLPQTVKDLLFDYSYNVGVSKFPRFFTGLIKGSKSEALSQYKRFTGGKPLGRRNKDTLELLKQYDFRDLTK